MGIGRLKRIVCLIVVTVWVFTLGVSAERSDVDSIIFISENTPELSSICSKANSVVDKTILVYTGDDGLLSFSNKEYNELAVSDKREFMRVALLSVKESGLGTQVKNKSYNFISSQDTASSAAVKYLSSDVSADFVSAASWLSPFEGFVGTLLGFISLLIFIVMGVSISIDLAYISLPMLQVMLGGSGDVNKPKFVSLEAYEAVKKATSSVSSNSYDSAIKVYARQRLSAIILTSICLGYLISGKIYDLVAYIIDSFTWVVWG